MADNSFSKGIEGRRSVSSIEGAPKIRSVRVDARTIREAAKNVVGRSPAGTSEMQYILANPKSAEADKLKDGNFHFFFGATDGVNVWCLYWGGGRFSERSCWLDNGVTVPSSEARAGT